MEDMSDTWNGLSSFMYTHNWWHLCLSYIDMDQAEEAHVDERLAWQRVARVAAPRIVDLAQQRITGQGCSLSDILPHASCIGGSIALRDLVHLFHLDMLMASGSFEDARQILEKRRQNRPNVRWIRQSLGRVYKELNLPQIARKYDHA